MGRIQYQLKKRLYRLKAYRRKGFGVHSPFAFQLITDVIEEKSQYYAFNQLFPYRKIIIKALKSKIKEDYFDKCLVKRCKEEIKSIESSESVDRLIFRLMIFWNSKVPAYFGDGIGFVQAYMAKADSRVGLSCFGREGFFSEYSNDFLKDKLEIQNCERLHSENLKKTDQVFDFIVFSENVDDKVVSDFMQNMDSLLSKRCMILVQNPHKNERIKLFWNQLKKLERISMSLDLFHIGILISREGMQKQDYVRKYRF